MKFKNPLLVVTDLEVSKMFYREVLGLHVILDFGANITLTGGICLQTKESWLALIQSKEDEVSFRGMDAEIYFEEDSFDDFLEKINKMDFICYVHPVIEHPWGQRVIRFYDPDHHIIEVGENMETVCKRFLNAGMKVEEITKRMGVPLKYVARWIRAGEKHGLK